MKKAVGFWICIILAYGAVKYFFPVKKQIPVYPGKVMIGNEWARIEEKTGKSYAYDPKGVTNLSGKPQLLKNGIYYFPFDMKIPVGLSYGNIEQELRHALSEIYECFSSGNSQCMGE